ncbi:type III secretion protein HrpN [Pantoea stewartii]|uniref:type III secretion protein HrpN n=1 Tax=Pantoea stewartii TaxID=66269 RepID=UPI0025A26197|nr:type III secretion protein HrpN [Pantoea stewartii]
MSMNTSPLGTSALQVTLGGNKGLMGTDLRTDGLGLLSQPGLGEGKGHNESIDLLAAALTGMMMMMSMMGGGGLSSLFGSGTGMGSGLGNSPFGGSGSAPGNTLSGTSGGSPGGTTGAGSSLGLDPTQTGDDSLSGAGQTSGMSPMEQLMKIFADITQSLFGDQDGASGGNAGRQPSQDEQNAYKKGVTDALTAFMGGGLSQVAGNGSEGGLDGGMGLGGGNGLGGKGLQDLSGPADFQQLGNAIGTGVGMKAGIEALNNIGTHSDSSTRSFINKEDRALAREVGQFMDQYPETFGKPQYQKNADSAVKTDTKSWAEALSQPDDDGMTPASMEQFNKAKGIIKSAMAGDNGNINLQARGAGGSSMGIDATLTGDAINNMALTRLSAA